MNVRHKTRAGTAWAAPPTSVRPSRGFTLVELLIVIVISSVLFISLATFARTSLMTVDVLQDTNLAEQTARTALDRLMREVSLAKSVAGAEAWKIAFTTTDITGDGADDDLVYAWDSGTHTLTRTLNGAAETFAENVTAFSLEYGYETEDIVTIASAGDSMSMTLGSFSGVSGGGYDDEEDFSVTISGWFYAMQYFNNLVEVPAATTATIRARTTVLPPSKDMVIYLLDSGGGVVASGCLNRGLLTTSYQDIPVALTWTGGAGSKMIPDKQYGLLVMAADGQGYAGRILCQTWDEGPALGGGLLFRTGWSWYGSSAAMYFSVLGDLPVTTPTRSTVPTSILKKVTATIRVAEGDQVAEAARTCKVVNQ